MSGRVPPARRSWSLAVAGGAVLLLGACATTGTHVRTVTAAQNMDDTLRPDVPPPPAPVAVPPGMQYLYGSGEAGAAQMAAFHALLAWATERVAHRPTDSVVLAPGSPIVHARFEPCGQKRPAAIFDADETVLLNLGYEADEAAHPGRAFDAARWEAWERTGANAVAALPGAVHAFDDLRRMGVTPVIVTNRTAPNAAATIAALKGAGLGEFRLGETLFLREAGAPSAKDARRNIVAARWCVIAMAGDQLGDFSDLFNAPMPVAQRRQLAVHSSAGGLWGKGWFMLPNPVYGTGLRGDLDDVFPADRRWTAP